VLSHLYDREDMITQIFVINTVTYCLGLTLSWFCATIFLAWATAEVAHYEWREWPPGVVARIVLWELAKGGLFTA